MPKRRRRQWAKWVCLATSAAIAAAWTYSGYRWLIFNPHPEGLKTLFLQRGGIGIQIAKPLLGPPKVPRGPAKPQHLMVLPAWIGQMNTKWDWQCPRITNLPVIAGLTGGGTRYTFPLWLPFSLCLLTSAALFWRDFRFRSPGACRQCGYDRAGLAANSRCPECGYA